MVRAVFIIKILTTVFALAAFSSCANVTGVAQKASIESKQKVTVTYIANEGVLIETDGKRVLIDGLHRFYKKAYAYPPDDLRAKLEGAKDPYNGIDLLLVSHVHGDHFHEKSVAAHLLNSSTARLFSSSQITEPVLKENDKVRERVTTIEHSWKTAVGREIEGIKVRFLGLRHGSERFRWIKNFGHIVTIGDRKFLHVGDADMSTENFAEFKIPEEKIDVAFVPFWFLLSKSGRELVEKQFAPKHMIAVHVSPSDADEVTARLKGIYPDITVFTKILETKEFE